MRQDHEIVKWNRIGYQGMLGVCRRCREGVLDEFGRMEGLGDRNVGGMVGIEGGWYGRRSEDRCRWPFRGGRWFLDYGQTASEY